MGRTDNQRDPNSGQPAVVMNQRTEDHQHQRMKNRVHASHTGTQRAPVSQAELLPADPQWDGTQRL